MMGFSPVTLKGHSDTVGPLAVRRRLPPGSTPSGAMRIRADAREHATQYGKMQSCSGDMALLVDLSPYSHARHDLVYSFRCPRPWDSLKSPEVPSTFSAATERGTPRGVAQRGSAPVWGAGGRRFESCRPDPAVRRPRRLPRDGAVFRFSLRQRAALSAPSAAFVPGDDTLHPERPAAVLLRGSRVSDAGTLGAWAAQLATASRNLFLGVRHS